MNTREIERFLEADTTCDRVFQEVYSADTLYLVNPVYWCAIPTSLQNLDNTGLQFTWMTMVAENISIRLDERLINISNTI